jgi:hypothetical protein
MCLLSVKLIILALFLLFSTSPSVAQSGASGTSRAAFIQTNTGPHYWGDILRESPDSVFLLQDNGVLIELPRRVINLIQYDEQKPSDHFWEGGLVLGSPSIINIVAGYQWKFGGIRASGFYDGTSNDGLQLNFCYNIHRSEFSSNYLSLVWINSNGEVFSTSTGNSQNLHFSGTGIAYDLNLSDFSIEAGAAQNLRSPFDVELLFQLGYVYQFR